MRFLTPNIEVSDPENQNIFNHKLGLLDLMVVIVAEMASSLGECGIDLCI